MLFVCYPRCSTCQKAKKYLEDRGLSFTLRDIKLQPPRQKSWPRGRPSPACPSSGFFNTSGQSYRALDLARRLPEMDEDAQLALLAADGMLVKRPILVTEDTVLVGFREKEWTEALK